MKLNETDSSIPITPLKAMCNNTYIEGLMRSLTETQKTCICEHYVTEDSKYVHFRIRNIRCEPTILVSFGNKPLEIDKETWNGYDCNMTLSDAMTLLLRYGLI